MISFFRIALFIALKALRQYGLYARQVIYSEPTLLATYKGRELVRLKIYTTFPMVLFEPSHRFFFQQKVSTKLRLACTYVSILTPLFDDYFERGEKQVLESLLLKMKHANEHSEELMLRYYHRLIKQVDQVEQLNTDIADVFEKQQLADLQKSTETLTLPQLEQITREKSAIGFFLILHLTNKPIPEKLARLIEQLAFLLQLGDDIFDLWFDLQEGSQTIATHAADADSLLHYYTQECQRLVELVHDYSSDKAAVKRFLSYYFFILSRVYVALKQYQEIDFVAMRQDPKNHRKMLVCDMETWKNNLKWMTCFNELQTLNR